MNDRPLVVVADDDESLRTYYRTVLERDGFDVLVADDGLGAIQHARARTASAILLDLDMPGLDGLTTVRQLRSDPALRTIPVLIVTGSSEEADRVAGLDLGADDVVVKPISREELVARVRAQIRQRTMLARELETEREHRRRLAALLPELRQDAPLLTLATVLADRLPDALDVDGVAILAFAADGTTSVAASDDLKRRFPPGRLLPRRIGDDVARRAQSGAWLDGSEDVADVRRAVRDLAYVPIKLGGGDRAVACLVYAEARSEGGSPMSHRLADLIDATDLIVAALRPAIEHAETTNAAILELRRLIADRQFAIHLQPIVRIDSGTLVAVEALTRFADGMRPDLRFAEAGRLGLGLALERATLTAAVEAAGDHPPAVALSVNVSPDMLLNAADLAEVLAHADRPVIVELTEHERIDDYEAVRTAFGRLGPNVQLAVDDAGSGYASLRHILSLRPAFVKLDMEWVRGIATDPIRRALVSGLAHFAMETGCELIAEGVETEEERIALLELGIRLGQGYLLGQPEGPSA